MLSLTNTLIYFVLTAVILIFSLSIHEFSHALAAQKLGDNTAKNDGRLSLNPLAHWDSFGTTILMVLLFLQMLGFPVFAFGWGKPVRVNPNNFENPALDNLAVSLAGPISNFGIAVVLGLLLRFLPLPAFLQFAFINAIFLNLVLMIFNLIPIPPLDGSKILGLFVPESVFYLLQQYGSLLLLVIIFFTSFLSSFIGRIVGFLFILITGHPSPI